MNHLIVKINALEERVKVLSKLIRDLDNRIVALEDNAHCPDENDINTNPLELLKEKINAKKS